MKKNNPTGNNLTEKVPIKHFLLIMRTTFILLFICVFCSMAEMSYTQNARVTINKRNVTLREVLNEIESQTDYLFIYNDEVNTNEKISVKTKQEKVYTILNSLLKGKDVNYSMEGNHIILSVIENENITENEIVTTATQQQKRIINGTVVDAKGQAIIGANIIEVGTTNGTVTDIYGKFSLSVENNAIINISYIGYLEQSINSSDRNSLDITLLEDTRALDDLVVIGYGRMKKSDLTGAVASVNPEKITQRSTVNIGQALSGLAAGVEIFESSGTPDGNVRIRIRGDNSINSSNDPLFVVDGVIGVSNMNLFNPNDIESIEVLKDASSTAIYGARGANGVIIITTKKGIKNQDPIISYDGYYSIGKMAKKINLMNASEWWENYNISMDNGIKYDPVGFEQGKYRKADPKNLPNLFDEDGNPLYDTDWQDETYKATHSNNHQISIRGGSERISYSTHFGYTHREALMKNDYLDRYTIKANFDSNLKKWLDFGVNIFFNYNTGNDNSRKYGIKRLVQEAIPLIPVKYPDQTWGSNRDFPGAVQDTPARYLEEIIDQTSNSQTISDVYFDFKINENLNLRSTFAIDINNRKRNFYSGKNLIQFSKNQGGNATIETTKQLYWQNENYINWNKTFNENNILNLMGGLSWQQRTAENLEATSQKFIDDFYQWHNLGAGAVYLPPSSNDWQWTLNSYFTRLNYNLYNKYLLTATGRIDGSSKFGGNNKYAFFPSFAFAWRLSEENFFKKSNLIDNLKIRTSIGETGNQEIGNYAFLQNLGSTNVIFGDTYYTALYRSSFGNPDLKWEKTTQFDLGIDMNLFSQRINFSLDYYYKITSNLLLNAPIPSTSGLSTIMRNIGKVENKGFEITLNTINIKKEHFNWSSTLLFATNKNKVLKLGENDEDIFPAPKHPQGEVLILRVGEPVGSLWGLRRLGTWSESETDEAAKYSRLPGDLKYADLNSDGKINSDDRTIIGRTSPDWTMSISNLLTYKYFDLSFDMRFVVGNKVVNAATHNAEDRSGVAGGWRSNLNAWTPEAQNTMIAQRRPMRTYYDSYPDDHWMQNGSFIRGQNLVLGYNFDRSFINKINLKELRMYVSMQNFFLITDYTGYDPEISTESTIFGYGIDDFAEPKQRTFTIGLNIKF